MNRRTKMMAVCVLLVAGVAGQAAEAQAPKLADIKPMDEVYKRVGDVELKMRIYRPRGEAPKGGRPAIVFFFGGGWTSGSPQQFDPHCRYFASRGMVAFAADYRVKSRHGVTPEKCVNDAKSAVRWIRANADRLGVDADRVVAAGGSAGGHLAACTGVVPGFDESGENAKISSVPNAMVLFNPALDISAEGFERSRIDIEARFAGKARELSPQHHVRAKLPPTLVLHGTADSTVPFSQATAFAKAMKEAGNRCEVFAAKGQGHGWFNYGRGNGKAFIETVRAADAFLASLGYLKGEATIE